MTAKSQDAARISSIVKWGLILGLPLIVADSCLPWYQWANVCHPISKTSGIQSRFFSGGGLLRWFIAWNAEGLDDSRNQTLYAISPEALKADFSEIFALLDPVSIRLGWGLGGLISPIGEGQTAGAAAWWVQQLSLNTDDFGEESPGLFWARNNRFSTRPPEQSLRQHFDEYYLFSSAPLATDTLEDWKSYKGKCPTLPRLYPRHWLEANPSYERAFCDMVFVDRGLEISYSIVLDALPHYKRFEDFFANDVLCEVKPEE